MQEIEHIKIAFIFGSYAKGTEDSISDIDLMIIGNPDEDKLVSIIRKLENEIDREIYYHIYSPADLKKKIIDKDSFIGNILTGSKIYLIGDKTTYADLILETK